MDNMLLSTDIERSIFLTSLDYLHPWLCIVGKSEITWYYWRTTTV